MKQFLILSVIFIALWEKYSPLPDFSRLEYDKYAEEAVYLSKGEVPVSILVFFKIENEKELFALLRKYPQCKGTSYRTWVKYIRPKLYKEDVKKILKYEEFYQETP
jgi:hypothetical protein